jgi:hypothetical protein
MKRPSLVYIEFYDHASGNSGWMSDDEIKQAGQRVLHQKAIGWLHSEDKTQLILLPWISQQLNEERHSACRLYIVKSTITKRRRLTAPR